MKKAFTLAEQLVVLIILGIIIAIMGTTLKPANINEEALNKASRAQFIQIEFATKQILAKYTNNYTLARMVDSTGEFSIAASASQARMLALYKKVLLGLRSVTLSSGYTSATLTNGASTVSGLSVSSFGGFSLKNGSYFGLKLHNNCTTEITYIYDPSTPDIRSKTNTCGILFFDTNGEKAPNLLGKDQFIVALGKFGVK